MNMRGRGGCNIRYVEPEANFTLVRAYCNPCHADAIRITRTRHFCCTTQLCPKPANLSVIIVILAIVIIVISTGQFWRRNHIEVCISRDQQLGMRHTIHTVLAIQ
jgi:hypothetical protein